MCSDIQVDILIAVGEKGGVENVVNKVGEYLLHRGMRVRVVQLVWEGLQWTLEPIPFYPLMEGRGGYTLDQFVDKYTAFLARHGIPDIILATAWPMMTLVARMSVVKLRAVCKVVSWLHAPIDRYVAAGFGGMECLEKADGIFVLTKKSRNIIQTYNPMLNVHIVRNSIDFTRCGIQPRNGWETRTLLFVGRFSVEKRVEVIIQAVSQAQDRWRLKLIGDGEEGDKLKELVSLLDLEKQVIFMGWKQNPWKYAGDVSALVLASEYEGFSLVAFESLASGIPVISTPVDGVSEIIKPGVNGFLFPQGDSASLAVILDMISLGKMPPLWPDACRESVADYEEKKALAEFEEELKGVMDKISVIVPCYNVEGQIARCLDSILGQNLHKANIEIICIDDKSTDNTLKILEQYENKYPEQILLIPLDENGKQGNARNIGMAYASGSYITFVDADDIIAPEMLETLYEKAVAEQCDVVECAYKEVCAGDILSVEEKGVCEYMDMRRIDQKKRYILEYGWKTAPWGRLYRREFLEDNQIIFPTETYMEDIFFSECCMLCMHIYARVPYTFYFYCINASGVMCSDGIVDYYMDTPRVQDMTTQFVMERDMAKDCLDEYAYLHFSKAFAEPMMRMCRDERFFSYDNFQRLKKAILCFFPDFLENPFVKADNSKEMELYRVLLQEEFPEQELHRILYFNQ